MIWLIIGGWLVCALISGRICATIADVGRTHRAAPVHRLLVRNQMTDNMREFRDRVGDVVFAHLSNDTIGPGSRHHRITNDLTEVFREELNLAMAALYRDINGAEPVTAHWDRLVERDPDDTTTVMCTTENSMPVALVLDQEHAEALAGSLLGGDDE